MTFYFYSQFVPHFQTEITQWAKVEKKCNKLYLFWIMHPTTGTKLGALS